MRQGDIHHRTRRGKSKRKRKPFDVILYGANSELGGQIVDFFISRHSDILPSVTKYWALSDTNKKRLDDKMETIRRGRRNQNIFSLSIHPDDCKFDMPEEEEDDGDYFDFNIQESQSLQRMCQVGAIIVNCCSDRAISEAIIKCCVQSNTHYIELVPNFDFAMQMREKYHAAARHRNLFFIFHCFWESIFMDVSVLQSQEVMSEVLPTTPDLLSLRSIYSYQYHTDLYANHPITYLGLLYGTSYQYVGNRKHSFTFCPKFPSFPRYNTEESFDCNYIMNISTANTFNTLSWPGGDENLAQSDSTSNKETFSHFNYIRMTSLFDMFLLYLYLLLLFCLCRFFLFSLIKWRQDKKSHPAFQYGDHAVIKISCFYTLMKEANLPSTFYIRNQSIPLTLLSGQDNTLCTTCFVDEPISMLFPQCVASCVAVLIQEKGTLVGGGCVTAGALGFPLVTAFKKLVALETYTEVINDDDDRIR